LQVIKSKPKKPRKCTGTLSALQKEIIKDCKDAQKALNTRNVYDYTFKQKVISATEKQAELIYLEYRDRDRPTDQLEDRLKSVSSLVRQHFRPESRPEVSRIIHDEFHGKYSRPYHSEEHKKLLDGSMSEFPECTDLATEAINDMKRINQIIKSDIMPVTAKSDLNDMIDALNTSNTKWIERNNLDSSSSSSLDDDDLDQKISQRNGPTITDPKTLSDKEIIIIKIREIMKCFQIMLDDIENRNYLAEDPEDRRKYILALDQHCNLLRPITDDRYAYDLEQSIDLVNAYKTGKLAMPIPLPEIDRKTGKVIMQPITKEQLENSWIARVNQMRHFTEYFPYFFDLLINYRACKQKYNAERRHDLSPKLIKKA